MHDTETMARIKRTREGKMKYGVYIALFGFIVFSGYVIGQMYYERGRSDCEKNQAVATQTANAATYEIRREVHQATYSTGVADIRQWLHDRYTIAE